MAVFHDQPVEAFRGIAILNIFAARARAELERQRAEELSLRRSEERLSSIIESALDAIIAINRDGCIMLFNRAAERLFRCTASEMLGPLDRRFLAKDLHQVLLEYMNRVSQDSRYPHHCGCQRGTLPCVLTARSFPSRPVYPVPRPGGR